MTPEEKARERIDQMLREAGWEVVDRDEITTGMQAQAVREALVEGNLEADYMLFIGNRAIGVLEAKRVEVDITKDKVRQQAINYTHKVPEWCQAWHHPLPIVYVSNGKRTQMLNQADWVSDRDEDWQDVSRIMSPKAMVELLGLEGEFVKLPALSPIGLRQCQYDAVRNLEAGFMAGKRRALIVLATGAGKTYTACLAAYRMLSYTPTKRVLFLVDRNNLGKQAEDGFGTFRLTENRESFSNIYGVERLKSPDFQKGSNVIISTIQRLFSVLTGANLIDPDDNEEQDLDEPDDQSIVTFDPHEAKLAPDAFDLIIIDECHRSIYSKWSLVLEYFSTARIIGLTATPSVQTLPFFDNNMVSRYSLEQSIADGVNVPCRVYSIETRITQDGGVIRQGERVTELNKWTGREHTARQKEEQIFKATEVNRDIIVPAQIDLIIQAFHDCIYRDLYPQRADKDPEMHYIPKTLIYALNDRHASMIVEAVQRIFGPQDERFVQKITYSAGDSNQLIRDFRNDKEFRIAVTVTLVATGTDVKPLEIVMFMRDVNSDLLYTQMKGRGVRTIGDEQLRAVTPNADTKDLFYLVDAAGVTKHDHTIPTTRIVNKPHLTLEQLLERITMGQLDDEMLYDLAGRLSRIYNRTRPDKRDEFSQIAGIDIKDLIYSIYNALGYTVSGESYIPSDVTMMAYEAPQLTDDQRKQLVLPLTSNPTARGKLLELNRGYIQTLNPGEDEIVSQGFSLEEARRSTEAFERYIEEHADEQEALRIIYNSTREAITYEMLTDIIHQLVAADVHFHPNQLWNYYSLLSPKDVTPFRNRDEREAITNIIGLVRYALGQTDHLVSLPARGASLFQLWCGQIQRTLTEPQKRLMADVLEYIIHNGSCQFDAAYKQANQTLAMQLISEFRSPAAAREAVVSLSSFIINNIA